MMPLAYSLVILALVIAIITKNGITIIHNKFLFLSNEKEIKRIAKTSNHVLAITILSLLCGILIGVIFTILSRLEGV